MPTGSVFRARANNSCRLHCWKHKKKCNMSRVTARRAQEHTRMIVGMKQPSIVDSRLNDKRATTHSAWKCKRILNYCYKTERRVNIYWVCACVCRRQAVNKCGGAHIPYFMRALLLNKRYCRRRYMFCSFCVVFCMPDDTDQHFFTIKSGKNHKIYIF